MTKGSVDRQPNANGSHPVSPENENQAAERRWLEDALEDDEVYEAWRHFVRQGWDGTDQGRPRKAPFDSRGKIPGAGHPMIEAFHHGQSTCFPASLDNM